MARQPCPECRRDVPVAPWCNRCGARLAELVHERPGVAGRRWGHLVGSVAVVLGLAVVGVGVATTTGGPGEADRPAEGEVVLDGPARSPDRGGGAVTVARPGGAPLAPAPTQPATPEPRTDVVCSDLRIRSVPSADLETTREGAVVELGGGECVVMGREGAAFP